MRKLSRNEWIGVAIAVAAALLILGPLTGLFNGEQVVEGNPLVPQDLITNETEEEMLEIEILTEGEGEVAEAGDVVTVHYVGTFPDGSTFDSSRDRGEPFSFELGAGSVIPGWEEGVEGMVEGEVRRLTIPPSLAYGEEGIVNPVTQEVIIPPSTPLIFEVELLEVDKQTEATE